ncbi:MAG TPA: hypothetical protein PLD23_10770 [Armatimonadota bacterium]|nr:hypothetical protein [Armatimonadota bacterium]HQK93979.1 hypothetical protein [Armatimonadota bacterium]
MVALCSWGLGWRVWSAALLGIGLGLGLLRLTEWAVLAATQPSRLRRNLLTGVFLAKLPVMGLVFYVITQHTELNAGALAGGLGVPLAVALLKLAGQALSPPAPTPNGNATSKETRGHGL